MRFEIEELVQIWFEKWTSGDYRSIPVSDDFQHTSPYGTIVGKREYLSVVEANLEKFLGATFEVHDSICVADRCCVRYTMRSGDSSLDVSEWFYAKAGLIESVISCYHVGGAIGDRG